MASSMPDIDEVRLMHSQWVDGGKQKIPQFARDIKKSESTVRRWLTDYAVNMGLALPDTKLTNDSEYQTHCVIPDVQAKPGVPLDHLRWAGEYIAEKRPDVIICIGDFADVQCFSHYSSKMESENRRYKLDLEACHKAMELLMTPIVNAVGYKPRLVMTPGNHEDRINRYVKDNPVLEGIISPKDLGFEAWGWEVHPYLKPVKIDGVSYCHYFYNPDSGKPYGGVNLSTRLNTLGHSFTMGHQQGLKVAIKDLTDGSRQRGLVAGSFYQHHEDYKGPQGNGHWQGIIFKHEVKDGNYDLMELSLKYLKRRYS